MAYKHKETGEFYDIGCQENSHGKLKYTFMPWNKSLEKIIIECDWVINVDEFTNDTPSETYWDASKTNRAALQKKIDEIFEQIILKPEIKVKEVPKYIKVNIELTCPNCGELLYWDGCVLLSSPAQYYHNCNKCGFKAHLLYHQGQILLGESTEEVYNILHSDSHKDIVELLNRKYNE